MLPLSGYGKAKKYADSHKRLSEQEIIRIRKKNPGPCLTISRQSGIDTIKLCKNLVQELKLYYPSEWCFFDKDLISKVINDHSLPERIQKFLGEERIPFLSQMLNELLGIHPPMMELMHKLTSTIYHIAELGYAVIIGRGSNIITSNLKNSYHIRLIAPAENRMQNLIRSGNLSRDEANKILLKEDEVRRDFLYRNFRQNIDDPNLYHQIINCSKFTCEELVNVIVDGVKNKYPVREIQKPKIISGTAIHQI